MKDAYDAIVVGAGPNGLAAAITLAREGLSVLVLEANATIGGGARSAELTLSGFVHDECSSIYPLGVGSPFFRKLPLEDYGLKWIHPPTPLAHPFDDGSTALLERSLESTGATLGTDDVAWKRLMERFVDRWEDLTDELLAPLHVPRRPILFAQFGWLAIRSATALALARFDGGRARALFAGLAAHAIQPLDRLATASYGLVLGFLGHAVGWPIAAGGAQMIANALAAQLRKLNGEIHTGIRVDSIEQLPKSRVFLFDVTPRPLLRIAGKNLPVRYRRRLEKYRHGPGAFKIDWALSAPIPWKAPECARAGTVHVGGAFEEIVASEVMIDRGKISDKPFVLVAQPSLFDPTRAPAGKHTAWAYCHVPNGSACDMTNRIESQIERFAPGFRDVILARAVTTTKDLEERNANLVGGDIAGGSQDFRQLFGRPVLSMCPYATPNSQIYICSAATPPGAGVHGMCGYHAASSALRRM